ncbi:MAG: cytochrome c [Nitrospirales bacterium]
MGSLALFITQLQAEPSQIHIGSSLFQQYCFDCHGQKKDGMGSLRHLLEQEPANLNAQATQAKTDQELFSIIKHGGGVEMHGWADTLTDTQIRSLMSYLRNPAE